MFFRLIYRNAKRSRQENLIYFATLVTAVASFYMILSLERQDVILYLRDFESMAVDRLFALMPILYGIALFLLFFLVLFANRYQLDRRSKEFGMYLMMGMRQRKLFALLLAEGLLTSLFALTIGTVIGGILAEMISLATSRLIGQGIIDHQPSFSLIAVAYTAVGFLFIQVLALLFLSVQLFNRELQQLLNGQVSKKQALGTTKTNSLTFVAGLIILIVAYYLALRYFWLVNNVMISLSVILGIIGTILLIRGLARLLNSLAMKTKQTQGLRIFTLRQLQENIANRAISVAVSSLLMMLSVMFLAEGAATILSSGDNLNRDSSVYHFTLLGDNKEIEKVLTSAELAPYVDHLNPLTLGYNQTADQVDWSAFRKEIVDHLPEGVVDPQVAEPGVYNISTEIPEMENILGLVDSQIGYLITESGYNRILEASNQPTIQLTDDQVALYVNPTVGHANQPELNQLLVENKDQPLLKLDGQQMRILPNLAMKDLVTDRSITIMAALVVKDTRFQQLVKVENRETYWNFRLPQTLIDRDGLMTPMKEANDLLNDKGFYVESYLQNFGRHLFYVVAGSYTMLYLAFLFLVIGCTVLALQFLTQLKQTKSRYKTLSFLGAKADQMQDSLKKQVASYFLFPLIPAMVSGTVGITAMKTYIRYNADFLPSISNMLPFVLMMVGTFLLVQWGYAWAVYKTATRDIA
ncbi:FtsX-like permease family protein [Jeotgalibaca arthritidis]|uniref:ABC transporter permease n=1 Tax=Jeotgalibaca arthritidis TaxID=1868794 RepID=A0A6G7KAU5_9LACT|nr:FtsX-like permease family protein [Jeotgalibaca arthritidis]QII82394.1 ABC transporter permease [Jeotgalibaca arthritidis]